MTRKAFDAIAAGLRDAIARARGEHGKGWTAARTRAPEERNQP